MQQKSVLENSGSELLSLGKFEILGSLPARKSINIIKCDTISMSTPNLIIVECII